MQPQYTTEAFLVVILRDGTRIARPVADYGSSGYALTTLQREGYDLDGGSVTTVLHRWWVRLVEPGLLPTGEWHGPYQSRAEAQAAAAALV